MRVGLTFERCMIHLMAAFYSYSSPKLKLEYLWMALIWWDLIRTFHMALVAWRLWLLGIFLPMRYLCMLDESLYVNKCFWGLVRHVQDSSSLNWELFRLLKQNKKQCFYSDLYLEFQLNQLSFGKVLMLCYQRMMGHFWYIGRYCRPFEHFH